MLDFIMSTNAMTRTTIGFFFITELVVLDVEGLTYAVSAGSDSAMQAGAIVPIFIIIATLFSGFFIGVTEIPAWLAWIKYISFVFYGFSALAQNEFDGQNYNFCFSNTTNSACTTTTGTEILNFYGLNQIPQLALYFILFGYSVLMRLIAWGILRYRGPKFDKSI